MHLFGLLDLWFLIRIRKQWMLEDQYEACLLHKISGLGIMAVKVMQYYAAFHPLCDSVEVRVGRFLQTHHHHHTSSKNLPELPDFLRHHGVTWSTMRLLAAGSVGTVYHASTLDLGEIVIKIQHPNVQQEFKDGIKLLPPLAGFLFCSTPEEMTDLQYMLESQFDFTVEARNMERFRQMYRSHPRIQIPRVYYSCPDTLVMEYKPCLHPPVELTMERGALLKQWVFHQILEHKVFHGDLHPGNWGFSTENNLVVYDLGYVYEIHDHSLLEPEVYHSLLDKDPQIVCNSLFKIFHIEHVPPKIRQDLTEIITASRGGPTTTLHMMQLLSTTRVLPLNRRLLFFLNLVMIMRHIHTEVPLLRLQRCKW